MNEEIAGLIEMHVKADGPVSYANIVEYVSQQFGGECSDLELEVTKALNVLMRTGVVELYDDGTSFTCGPGGDCVVDAETHVLKCRRCGDTIPIPLGDCDWVAAVMMAFCRAHGGCQPGARGGITYLDAKTQR